MDRPAHDGADALISGEVIEGPPVCRLTNASFLRTTSPLDHIVTRAEPRHWSMRINVGLTRIARVRFGEPEEVRATGAQEAVPEPQRHAQFGVVPCVAAPVVMP